MSGTMHRLIERYPELSVCKPDIVAAFETLHRCFKSGGKMLLAGNGGSAADCEHIVGELMKGFMSPRKLPIGERERFAELYGEAEGSYLADHLQGALPAIALTAHSALISAFANDVAADMAFAQQVYGYGKPEDVLIVFSTSGNSVNIVRAVQVAKARGLATIGFTGRSGGKLKELVDTAICVPCDATPDIQERHLPIYHALCILLEEAFFT